MKKTGIGMLMIVILVVGVRHAFFYTSTETPLGEAFVILLLGFMYLDREKSYSIFLFYPLSAVFILLAFFSHPITLFPLLFVILFVMLDTKSFLKKKYYILLVFIAIIYSLKYFTTETDSYEGKIFSRLTSFAALLNDINTSYAFRFINSRLNSLYQLPIIWFLLTSVFYMLKKEYSKILFYLTFNFLFFVILILTFQKGDSTIAMEKNIMPIILTTFIPLMVETGKIQQKQWSIIAQRIVSYSLIVIILISSYYILRTNIYYKNRIAYLWEMVNTARTYEGRKFIVESENINPEKLGVEYSLSTETLLLTSFESPDSSLTIHCLLKSLAQTYDTTSTDQFIFMPNWPVNLKNLNSKYFRLPEGKYKKLNEKFN